MSSTYPVWSLPALLLFSVCNRCASLRKGTLTETKSPQRIFSVQNTQSFLAKTLYLTNICCNLSLVPMLRNALFCWKNLSDFYWTMTQLLLLTFYWTTLASVSTTGHIGTTVNARGTTSTNFTSGNKRYKLLVLFHTISFSINFANRRCSSNCLVINLETRLFFSCVLEKSKWNWSDIWMHFKHWVLDLSQSVL